MAKTKMSDKKRKELLPFVYKKIVEKYPQYDIDVFDKEWKQKIAKQLDDVIKKYYGERFIGEYDWLKSQGFLHKRDFHISDTPIRSYKELDNNIFCLKFTTWFYPNLLYGVSGREDTDKGIDEVLSECVHSINKSEIYSQACQNFCNEIFELAKPILVMINSAKYCEDILEFWDTMEVRKVLFPEKVYPISTLTAQDIENLKNFFK